MFVVFRAQCRELRGGRAEVIVRRGAGRANLGTSGKKEERLLRPQPSVETSALVVSATYATVFKAA